MGVGVGRMVGGGVSGNGRKDIPNPVFHKHE